MKKTCLTLLAISLSSTLIAAENDGEWFINPTLGYQFMDSDRNLDDDALLGLGLEHRFNQTWGSELKYLQGSMDSDISGSNDADTMHLMLEGMYYLNDESNAKFSPYLAAGLGHAEYDYDFSGKNQETTALAGAGFRYGINDRWSSKVDLRWVHGIDDSTNDGLLTVALSYVLGKTKVTAPQAKPAAIGDADKDGVNDNVDQCKDSSAGATVNSSGCELDTDKDGISNGKDQCPNTAMGAKVDSNGCAEKLTQTETITLNVTFATSSDTLTNNFMSEIEKVALFMRKYASVTTVIEGYTDSRGTAEFNKTLSQARAESVLSILVDQFGIDSQRLRAKGYGEEKPIASNDTAEGRQKNRRVSAVFEAQVVE